MKIASLCVLAYNRYEFLYNLVQSLFAFKAGYPYELIIHNDGSTDPRIPTLLENLRDMKRVSFTINNAGRNMGIEKSLKHCIGVSHGDYIFKLDHDLQFIKDGWLDLAIYHLKNKKVGAVGLLDYSNYDPKDERFHNKKNMDDYYLSDNFVSSGYGFRKGLFQKYGHEMKNDGWHKLLHRKGYELRILKPDVVQNIGFGIPNSVYVGKDLKAVKMYDEPLIFI